MSESQGGKFCFLAEENVKVTKDEDQIVSIEANRYRDVLYGRRCRPRVTQLVKPSDESWQMHNFRLKGLVERYRAEVCCADMQAKDIA